MAKSPEQIDPQRLQAIRNPLVKTIDQRYKLLAKAIYQKLVKDGFLQAPQQVKHKTVKVDTETVTTRPIALNYTYPQAASQKQEFLTWLDQQLQEGAITDKNGKPITVTSDLKDAVYSSWKQGAQRAYIDAHKPPKHGPKSDHQYIDGQKEQFLQDAFNAPTSLSTMELIASRAFDQLDGIDANMSKQMSRIFAEAVLKGENPRKVAAKLVKEVGLTSARAKTIARTEMAFAHSEGQLASFEKQGITEVHTLVEWSTAEDERVCPKCAAFNEQIFKLKDAHGLIPHHPNCCIHPDTKVFTKAGWKNISEVDVDTDLFLSENPDTGETEFVKAVKHIVYDYDGPAIEYKNDDFQLTVTANHNMYMFDTHTQERSFQQAHEPIKPFYKIPRTLRYFIGQAPDHVWIENYLLTFDAYCRHQAVLLHAKCINEIPDVVKYGSIVNLSNFFIDYVTLLGKEVKFGTYFDTDSEQLMSDLCWCILRLGGRPIVTKWFVEDMDGLYSFDGQLGYYTYRIEYHTSITEYVPESAKRHFHHTGKVYCVELEKWHTLYVMEDGKCTWTGNCRCAWIPPAYNPNATYEPTGDEIVDQLAAVEVAVKRTPPYVQQSPENFTTYKEKFLNIEVQPLVQDALENIETQPWKDTELSDFQTTAEAQEWLNTNVLNYNPVPPEQEPTRLHTPIAIVLEGSMIPLLLGGQEYLHRGNILESSQQIPGQLLYSNDGWTPDDNDWQFRILIPKGMAIFAAPNTSNVILPTGTRLEINEVNGKIVKATVVRKPKRLLNIGRVNNDTQEFDTDFSLAFDNAKKNIEMVTNALTMPEPVPDPIFVPSIMTSFGAGFYDPANKAVLLNNSVQLDQYDQDIEDIIEETLLHESLHFVGENGKIKHTNTLLDTIAAKFHRFHGTKFTTFENVPILKLPFKVSNQYSQRLYKIDNSLPDSPDNFIYGKELIPEESIQFFKDQEAYKKNYPEMYDFLHKILTEQVKDIDVFDGIKISKLENNDEVTDQQILNEVNAVIAQTPTFQLDTPKNQTEWHKAISDKTDNSLMVKNLLLDEQNDKGVYKAWNAPLKDTFQKTKPKAYAEYIVDNLFSEQSYYSKLSDKTTLSTPIALHIIGYDAIPLTFGGTPYMEKGNVVLNQTSIPAKIYYAGQSTVLNEGQWEVIIQVPANTPLYVQKGTDTVAIPKHTHFLVNDRTDTTVLMMTTTAPASIINLSDDIKPAYIRAQEVYDTIAEAFQDPPTFRYPIVVSNQMMKGLAGSAAGVHAFGKTWLNGTYAKQDPSTFAPVALHEAFHVLNKKKLKGTNVSLDNLCSAFHREFGTKYGKESGMAYWLFPFEYYRKYSQRVYSNSKKQVLLPLNTAKDALLAYYNFGLELFTAESEGIVKYGFEQYKEKYKELGAFFEKIFKGQSSELSTYNESEIDTTYTPLPSTVSLQLSFSELVEQSPSTIAWASKAQAISFEYQNKKQLLTEIKNSGLPSEWQSLLTQKVNQLAPSGTAVYDWSNIQKVVSTLPMYDRIAGEFALEQNNPLDIWCLESFAGNPFQGEKWIKQIANEVKYLKKQYGLTGYLFIDKTDEQKEIRKLLKQAVNDGMPEAEFRKLLHKFVNSEHVDYVAVVPSPVPIVIGSPPFAPSIEHSDTLSSVLDTSFMLYWSEQEGVDKFTVTLKNMDYGGPSIKHTVEGYQTYFKFNGLNEGTNYSVRLRAVNQHGKSDYAEMTIKTVVDLKPPDPFQITLVVVTATTLEFAWDAVADHYKVELKNFDTQQWQTLTDDTTDTSWFVKWLDPETTYTVKVTATNSNGSTVITETFDTAPGTKSPAATKLPLPHSPPQKFDLSLVNQETTSLAFSWENKNASEFKVSIYNNSTSTWTTIAEHYTGTSIVATNLIPNTKYMVSVTAYNPNGFINESEWFWTNDIAVAPKPKAKKAGIAKKWMASSDKLWAYAKTLVENVEAAIASGKLPKTDQKYVTVANDCIATQDAHGLLAAAKQYKKPMTVKAAQQILQFQSNAPLLPIDRKAVAMSQGFDQNWTAPLGTPTVKQLAGGYSGSSASKLVYPNGEVIVRKTPPNKKHMQVELLASQIYAITALPAPHMQTDGDSIFYAYNADAAPKPANQWSAPMYKSLADHAIVGLIIDNRDWVGENNDNNNILWDANNQPFAIDHGSAFEFRATGPKKDQPYDSDIKNIEAIFIRSATKGQARHTFATLTEAEVKQHCIAVTQRFSPSTFDALKKKFPSNKKNIEALEAHVEYYRDIGTGKRPIPQDVLDHLAKQSTQQASKEFHLPPRNYTAPPANPDSLQVWEKKSITIGRTELHSLADVKFSQSKGTTDTKVKGAYKAMKSYTASGYSAINRGAAPRRIENDGSITPLKPKAVTGKNNFAYADQIYTQPAPKDMHLLRRGIMLPDEKNPGSQDFWKFVPDNIYTTFQPGTEWNIFTWISTSIRDVTITRHWPLNHIYIPKGTLIMPVGQYSSHSNEDEVILTPLTRFRVLKLNWKPAKADQEHYSGVDNTGKKVILEETHLLLVYKEHDPMK